MISRSARAYRKRLKRKAKDKLGGVCKDCGTNRNLKFHHSNKNGNSHRLKIGRSSDALHRFVVNGGRGISLLCKNCHEKEHYGELPCPSRGLSRAA